MRYVKKLFASQLQINMMSGSGAALINLIIAALGYPLYLHYLGYEKYGVWLVLTTVLSFAALGNLGIAPAIVKLVAEEKGRGNMLGVQSYVTTALLILLSSGSIVLVILLFLRQPIVAVFDIGEDNATLALSLLPYIGMLCIYSFVNQVFEATLSALGRIDLAHYVRTLGHAVQITVSGAFLFAGYGVTAMVIGSFASCVTIHVFCLCFVSKIAKCKVFSLSAARWTHLFNLIRFGGTILSGTFMSMLLIPFNKLMLARYSGIATLPVFEIANSASMHIRGLIEVALRALLPEMSRIQAHNTETSRAQFSSLHAKATRIIATYGFLLFSVIFLMAPFMFSFWFRDNYAVSMPLVFRIMLAGTFMSLLGVPAYYGLMASGRVVNCFVAHMIQSASNVFLVLLIVFLADTLLLRQAAVSVSLGMGLASLYLIGTMRGTLRGYQG